MTFGELNYSQINELDYGVNTSVNVVSLELVPLNLMREVTIQDSFQTPDVKLGYGGTELGIGKIYGRDVTIKSAKPTILASGLGTNEFYWTMTEDAIHKGSRKFFAVLGVPPKTKEVVVEFWGAIKYQIYGWQNGSWANTKPFPYTLKLSP